MSKIKLKDVMREIKKTTLADTMHRDQLQAFAKKIRERCSTVEETRVLLAKVSEGLRIGDSDCVAFMEDVELESFRGDKIRHGHNNHYGWKG